MKNKAGLYLVEWIVIVCVISLFASIAIPSYQKQKRDEKAKKKAQVEEVRKAKEEALAPVPREYLITFSGGNTNSYKCAWYETKPSGLLTMYYLHDDQNRIIYTLAINENTTTWTIKADW